MAGYGRLGTTDAARCNTHPSNVNSRPPAATNSATVLCAGVSFFGSRLEVLADL